METKDGLPIYHVSRHDCWTDNMKVGDMFYFVTENIESGEEHTFKLVKTEDMRQCNECPLGVFYDCHGVDCCIKNEP